MNPNHNPNSSESPVRFDDILLTKLSNLEISQRRNSNHSIHSNSNAPQSPTSLGLDSGNINFSPQFLPQLDNSASLYLNQGFNNIPSQMYLNTHPPFPNSNQNYQFLPDSFNLPLELQGGIGNISSRRPSYAAESFTRSDTVPHLNLNGFDINQNNGFKADNKHSLATFAAVNNFNNQQKLPVDQFNDSFVNFNLNANLNDFQQRRPSQLATFNTNLPAEKPAVTAPNPDSSTANSQLFNPSYLSNPTAGEIKLDNGLILRDQYIVASPDLKSLYMKTIKYFQDVQLCEEIILNLKTLLANEVIIKLITFIKNLNNLNFNHKMLCLVVNKNGKFDLLSYPNNSNIFLQKNDLVIVDGDRGKDLVMILEPLLNLNFAILFNFLKKFEHLKSLTIYDSNHQQVSNANPIKKSHSGGTHSTSVNASYIINSHSNEDNEFIITLPTKQVLRFATPKEVHKISGKFLEEKKAFITCFNKVKELNLNNDLELINVEYQSDFKKLIFYYYANFKRIDFRGLIKELFKIYKTRIWLCAVLPYNKPELYTIIPNPESSEKESVVKIPLEYELSNDQILNFSINEFDNLSKPNYFHLKNLLNLVNHLMLEVKGNFYGFNPQQKAPGKQHQTAVPGQKPQSNILPSFNPFGDSN